MTEGHVWICPKCGRVYGPTMHICPSCNAKIEKGESHDPARSA